MKTSDFWFDLPPECIAQYPSERGKSRLMVLERSTGKREHRMVEELPDVLSRYCTSAAGGPLLVYNNSRVRKARLPGRSCATGKTSDFLLISRVDSRTWRALVGNSKRKKPGSRYCFEGGLEAELVPPPCGEPGCTKNEMRCLRFDSPVDDAWLDRYGHIPLPPYIARPDEATDCERYQTVYADRKAGAEMGQGASAAAPTAGLHFTRGLLEGLEKAGIETAFVTLHVGPGTFFPVRTENIEDHPMHEEAFAISEETAHRVNRAKAKGRKIAAIGTTAARTLESAWGSRGLSAGEGLTSIFIYPGRRFRAVDALFTNFHTPGSTLIMLAAAFAENADGARAGSGRRLILESYAEAIRKGYRFFSYGDAMFMC